jgi:hypothetical protein
MEKSFRHLLPKLSRYSEAGSASTKTQVLLLLLLLLHLD